MLNLRLENVLECGQVGASPQLLGSIRGAAWLSLAVVLRNVRIKQRRKRHMQ